MSDTETGLSLVAIEPGLKSLLDAVKTDVMLSLNCHHIGTIQSFDPATQTVTATINYKQTYYRPDPTTGISSPVLVDYPLLVDCPVIILGGGTTHVTFPIKKGDQCVILFNDRDIDKWFSSGALSAPPTSGSLHCFADGLVLVGLNPMTSLIANYDMTRAVLRNGTTMVGVGAALIKIANATTTLNTLLQSLISAINAIQVAPGTFNIAANPVAGKGSIDPASASALSAIGTQISGLLE